MTYAIGGLILASEFNSMINGGTIQNGVSVPTATPLVITPGVNTAWSVGAASAGYGQPAFTPVTVGQVVRARAATVVSTGPGTVPTWSSPPEWRALVDTVNNMSLHQIGPPAPITAVNYNTPVRPAAAGLPTTGPAIPAIITWANILATQINTVSGIQRLDAFTQRPVTPAETFTVTSGITWSNSLQLGFTVSFGSADRARWFFNAGGQIGISCSHPAGAVYDIDQLISDLCNDAGTIWISSTNGTPATVNLSGIPYNGITKVGGANPAGIATLLSNHGFYAMTPVSTSVFRQTSDFYYFPYGGTFFDISTSYNGAGSIGINLLWDEIPNGALVSTGTTATVVIRYPADTISGTGPLVNSWGIATVTNTGFSGS